MQIRHSLASDLNGIKRIYQQPCLYGNTLHLPYQSDELWLQRLNSCSDNNISLVAVEDQQVLGQLSLIVLDRPRRKHVATIGMGVSTEHSNKGIGSSLMAAAIDMTDNWLNISRTELEVFVDNEAAISLYKKFGFEVEGVAKNYGFKNGLYVDALLMARIK